jgi:phosphotriesterase-related protein
MMTRRRWIAALATAQAARSQPVPRSVLVHEHILVDFVGADQIKPGRYNAGEVFRAARPKLEELKQYGCHRLLECTPNFLGRDGHLLARLSDATGLEIWTNTGLSASLAAAHIADTRSSIRTSCRRWTAHGCER